MSQINNDVKPSVRATFGAVEVGSWFLYQDEVVKFISIHTDVALCKTQGTGDEVENLNEILEQVCTLVNNFGCTN